MREPHSYATPAIMLKYSDFAEADRLMTLLTPYKGKIQTIAKGVRRPISKKTGHLDLLGYSQLQVATGRNLDIITQAETIEPFLHLRRELWHMTCGFYLAELTDRFLEDKTQHTDVYKLLLETLRCLNADALSWQSIETTSSNTVEPDSPSNTVETSVSRPLVAENASPYAVGTDVSRPQNGNGARKAIDAQRYGYSQLLLRYFEISLLSYIGYEPVFRTCAHCDAELQPVENGFAPALGGALCPDCSHLWAHSLSMNALKVLRLLQRTDWERVPRFRLDMRLHLELENAMHGLLRYHLERDLKSWSFLEMIRHVSER